LSTTSTCDETQPPVRSVSRRSKLTSTSISIPLSRISSLPSWEAVVPVNGFSEAPPNGTKMASRVSPTRGISVGTSSAKISSKTVSRVGRSVVPSASIRGARPSGSIVKVGSTFSSGAHKTAHRSGLWADADVEGAKSHPSAVNAAATICPVRTSKSPRPASRQPATVRCWATPSVPRWPISSIDRCGTTCRDSARRTVRSSSAR